MSNYDVYLRFSMPAAVNHGDYLSRAADLESDVLFGVARQGFLGIAAEVSGMSADAAIASLRAQVAAKFPELTFIECVDSTPS